MAYRGLRVRGPSGGTRGTILWRGFNVSNWLEEEKKNE